jgi:hypothetical protein
MVGGIIVDYFAKLRGYEKFINDDMRNICTICGKNIVEITKIYDKFGKSYKEHFLKDHAPINYIFYIYYLSKKETTEFTGMESYVYNLVFIKKDITFFPENR